VVGDTAVFTGSGYVDSASVFAAEIAFAVLWPGRLAIVAWSWLFAGLPGTLARSRCWADRPSGACGPSMPVWAVRREWPFR